VLVVDWIPAQGVWFDGIMFIFDGGVLTDEQIERITLDATEARRFQFLTLDQASDRMRPSMVRRLARAQEALRQGAPLLWPNSAGLPSTRPLRRSRQIGQVFIVPESPWRLVREFHEVFELAHPDQPTPLASDLAEARQRILDEEVRELADASRTGDLVEIAHELADVVYHPRMGQRLATESTWIQCSPRSTRRT